jgi:hypothetical protein
MSSGSNRSRHSVMRPSRTSKVPQTQKAARTGPMVMASVRSVSTTGPLDAMLCVTTSNPSQRRSNHRSCCSTAAIPRAGGKGTFW